MRTANPDMVRAVFAEDARFAMIDGREGPPRSHCGINSIEMLHDGDDWKVTQISDTRRQSDCPDPLG